MLLPRVHTLWVTVLLGGGIYGANLHAARRVTLADGQLALGNSRFVVRGVAYSNAAIGEPASCRLAASNCRLARDLPLIARLGANTVRTYALLGEEANSFVELLESTGLYWLAGFPLEPYYDPARAISARKRQILDAFGEYAQRFRGQRRLIGYVFGNEVTRDYHAKFAGSVEDFFVLLGEAAELLRQIEPEQTPLLTTAVHDAAELARTPAGLSFWCWNANPGRSFSGSLEEARRRSAKPVLISEFGVDAFDERTRQEDERAQAEAAATLLNEIEAAGWLLGGVYSSFLDEWWRGGPDAGRHGAGGSSRPGFPDGFRNDGWTGIFRVSATEQPGLDSLAPRAVYGALAARWGGSALPAAADPPRLLRLENAASGMELVAPGTLVRASGERLASAATSAEGWPLHLGQSCLCVGSAAARLARAAPDELSGHIPPSLPPGETKAVGYRAGLAGGFLPVRLRRYAPGIFPRGVVWAGTNCVASRENGVRAGDVLEVYATGLGLPAQDPVEAFIRGAAAPVLYSGPLAGMRGVDQVNVQVPPEVLPGPGLGLELRVGGAASNVYPLGLVGPGDLPAIALRASAPEIVLQAGGEPRTASVEVEGINGFCGAVLFQALQVADGLSFQIPAAFPGQTVPLALRAAPGMPALQDGAFALVGYSGGASARLTLRITVLPNQGDVPVRVFSGGFKAGALARFDWNGRTLFSTSGGGPGRGLNVLSVNPATGVFSAVRGFDTWDDEQASSALVEHLGRLPLGTIVLMAVADEATYRLTEEARTAIAGWFGSQFMRTLGYQHSWALIGRKGASKPLAEAASPDRQILLERILTLPQP